MDKLGGLRPRNKGQHMAESSSLTPAMIALAFPAAAAVILTALRPHLRVDGAPRRRLLLVVGLMIIGQVFHFIEELYTQLYVQFPTSFGFPPAPQSVFIGANVAFLGIWIAALVAIREGLVIGLLPLWFLGFCEVLNLLLHPFLALRAGGYFSGVATAPIVGMLGMLTLRELFRVTAKYDGTTNGIAL